MSKWKISQTLKKGLFDLIRVIAFARSAEAILKQIMALRVRQTFASAGALPPFTIFATASRVLSYKIDCGTPPKKSNAAT